MCSFDFDATIPFKRHDKKQREKWVAFGLTRLLAKCPEGVDLDDTEALADFMRQRKTIDRATHGFRLFHMVFVLCRYRLSDGFQERRAYEEVAQTSRGWQAHR
jgi:hypothetical protein